MVKFFVAASAVLVAFAAFASAHDGEDHSTMATPSDPAMTTEAPASATNTSLEECPSSVSASFIATIDNSTYFNTCAEGTTFNISSVFTVLNFTDANFFTFCNSSTCLEPVHALMDSVDCLIPYEGSLRDLGDEVSDLHDRCHDVLDEAGEGMDMSGRSRDSTPSSSPPEHTSRALAVVLTIGPMISAAILAAFLV